VNGRGPLRKQHPGEARQSDGYVIKRAGSATLFFVITPQRSALAGDVAECEGSAPQLVNGQSRSRTFGGARAAPSHR
jgi:hypothetical protein